MADLVVYGELQILWFEGFQPDSEESDALGTWQGFWAQDVDDRILSMSTTLGWGGEYTFTVLCDGAYAAELLALGAFLGYDGGYKQPITERCFYGSDGEQLATVCKHPDGWIVL